MFHTKSHNPIVIIVIPLNLLAVLALVFSLLAGSFAPSTTALFAVFGLMYPMIFIINLLMLMLLVFFKSKWLWLNILVLVAGSGNMLSNFQFSTNKAIDDQGLKVVSYNVQQFSKGSQEFTALTVKNDILNFLKEEDASVVCLQEFQSHDQNLYQPLKTLKDSLHAGTYYFESYYNPRYNYLSGLVIFSKFPAINKGKLKFEGSRTFGIYTDLLYGNDTLRVFNIHLANIRLVPEDIEFVMNRDSKDDMGFKAHSKKIISKLSQAFRLREKQIEYVIEILKTSPKHIILCGDFNDTPSSFVYHQLMNYLDDSFTQKGNGIGRTYAGDLPMLRIDYIMSSNSLEVSEYNRHKLRRSDHFPISARLKLSQ